MSQLPVCRRKGNRTHGYSPRDVYQRVFPVLSRGFCYFFQEVVQ